jgi:high-affinity iron transporter
LVLIVFAAGLAGYGVHELIEAGESFGVNLGVLAAQAFNINPADASSIFHESGALGSILRALVGYDGNPEWLRVFVYLGYWLVVGGYALLTYGYRREDAGVTSSPGTATWV